MASSAPASNFLETLPTRPPTPPREAQQGTQVSLKTVLSRTPKDPRSSLQTPPNVNSPSLVGASKSNPGSKRMRKRVEWSAHTEYKDPPQYPDGGRPSKSSPLSTPSSALSKPVKGILKPSPSPNPLASSLSQLDGSEDQPNIAEMLESTIKQLAGSDRDSRLDAYMMLARALKASNNLPDRVALQNKMGLFMQFIQRDMVAKNDQGSLDTQLTTRALTLLTTFLHFQAIASTLTSEFGIFVIEHCIRSFEDPAMSKDVVRNLMQVAAFQSFSPKVMTMDRVGRLVVSLHKIDDHLTGKSIVMGRIQIYKRLVKQSKSWMAVQMDWLEDVFTDMLSPVKDIRSQAISLGAEAGFALRNDKQLMRKVTEIFQTTNEEQTYIEFYIDQMQKMLKEKQNPSVVPQIWGVIILFLRCPLDRWQHFGPWLTLAQSAFNIADSQTKLEANNAWNRYVYLCLTDNKANPKTLSLLVQPLNSQLKRKFNPKQSESMKLRKAVVGCICNLYYYALRPSHDQASTDVVWKYTVQPTMKQLSSEEEKQDGSKDSLTQASRILVGLLDVSTPRAWREERVRDTTAMSPEELPSLDSKWIRRNSKMIFAAVGPILKKKFIDLANTDSLTYRLWKALCGSIAVASAKDIKVSEETVNFIACSFAVLSEVWPLGPSNTEQATCSKFLSSVSNFIHVLVRALGLLPFTEKKLVMTVSNVFEPISTPSHRPDRVDSTQGVIRSPLCHLFSMLCSIPQGATDDDELSDFVQFVFEPFFKDKNTKGRLELAREMLRLLPRDTLSPYGPWILAAQNFRLMLESNEVSFKSGTPSNDRLLGPEYREVVCLLERGLVSHPRLPPEHWFSLFDLLSQHVLQECGDAGKALGVVEPISKILLDNLVSDSGNLNQMAMRVTSALLGQAKLPRDRQAIEAARRRLWGAPPTTPRAQSFDPFDYLYKLTNKTLELTYNTPMETQDLTTTGSCIESLATFVAGTFAANDVKCLAKLQDGITSWIRDESAQFKLSGDLPVSKAVRSLLDNIASGLISIGRLGKDQFDQLEPLFTAAFRSKHRLVVNQMVETWNTILKDEDSLECSDSLKSVAASLRPSVDIILPGVESSGEFGAQAPVFIESQDDLKLVASSSKSSRQTAEQASPQVMSASKTALKGRMTRKRQREETPEVKRLRSSKRTSTPRLRHDNSQIQFAPIASSSPLVEKSQNLTERQKEVRERQRENAGLYSSVQSGPRTRSRGPVAEQPAEVASSEQVRGQEVTPEPAASYEEFISSTPTPRRGHSLQMEDYNDPPSSPPEPRRNPLLSEIQSRSKATSSLESWEFSSPPGSPVSGQQQQIEQAVEIPQISLTNDSTQSKERGFTSPEDLEIIPSSLIEDAELSNDVSRNPAQNPLSAVPQVSPTTPLRQDQLPVSKAEETSKPGEDDFVDVRSSPEQPSHNGVPRVSQDTSFALSEGDESSMMRFVVELESRRCNLPVNKFVIESPVKNNPSEDCITVHTDSSLSSPPPEGPKNQPRSVSPTVPTTPAESETDMARSGSKRKRGRGTKTTFDARRRKRRSTEVRPLSLMDDGQAAVTEEYSSPAPSVRRSLRSRKIRDLDTQELSIVEPRSGSSRKTGGKRGTVAGDAGGDTDEEVLSQLVSESNAASQSQSLVDPSEGRPLSDEPMELEFLEGEDETTEQKPILEADNDNTNGPEAGPVTRKASSIMEMLRDGLQNLRGASLSREEVYQMEDLLMDMKRELFEAERRGRR